MKKNVETFFSFSVIPGRAVVDKLHIGLGFFNEATCSIISSRCSHNFIVSAVGSPIIQLKEDLAQRAKDAIRTAFETSIMMNSRKAHTAILLYAKGKAGVRYDVEKVGYVKLLDDLWPEYQMGGLSCRMNFSLEDIAIFPIYYFYGKLKIIQAQVMKIFESIVK